MQSAGSVAGFTAEQVEEVRMVVRMFPIFLTTIFYWTIYSQVRGPAPPRLPSQMLQSPTRYMLMLHMHILVLPIDCWIASGAVTIPSEDRHA